MINEINKDNIEVHQDINVVNDQDQRNLSSENSEPSSSQGHGNDLLLLWKQKKSNHNRLIFSTLHVNSVPNKLDDIRITIADFVDILVIIESKLDQSFPDSYFLSIGSPSPLGKTEIGMVADFSCILRKKFHRKNYLSIDHLTLKYSLN